MTPWRPIALVGLSATGKSTVGPLLAGLLDVPYRDTDELVIEAMGCTVPEAFDTKGEAWFRSCEAEILEGLILRPVHVAPVISVAAGAVQNERNRQLLRQLCDTFWLLTPLAILPDRLSISEERPLLRDDPLAKLSEQAQRRYPMYDQASRHHVWATTEPAEVAQTIVELLNIGGPSCCGVHGERFHQCSIVPPSALRRARANYDVTGVHA